MNFHNICSLMNNHAYSSAERISGSQQPQGAHISVHCTSLLSIGLCYVTYSHSMK